MIDKGARRVLSRVSGLPQSETIKMGTACALRGCGPWPTILRKPALGASSPSRTRPAAARRRCPKSSARACCVRRMLDTPLSGRQALSQLRTLLCTKGMSSSMRRDNRRRAQEHRTDRQFVRTTMDRLYVRTRLHTSSKPHQFTRAQDFGH